MIWNYNLEGKKITKEAFFSLYFTLLYSGQFEWNIIIMALCLMVFSYCPQKMHCSGLDGGCCAVSFLLPYHPPNVPLIIKDYIEFGNNLTPLHCSLAKTRKLAE